jgi:CelD/BcsL family acetyltransferase involved in cellulose biosynthesis
MVSRTAQALAITRRERRHGRTSMTSSKENNHSSETMATLSFSLERLDDIKTVAVQWKELEARSDCSFFLSWDWIGTWLATAPGSAPLLLSVRDSGALVALAIFHTAKLRRRFMPSRAIFLNRTGNPYNDIINIEYNNVLTDRRYSKGIWPAVIAFLRRAEIPAGPFRKWDELHVAMATQEIERFAHDAKLMVLELAQKPSWFVDLDAIRQGGKPYLDTLSSNARYQIRRAIRFYEKEGPVVGTRAQSLDQAIVYLAELKEMHQAYWTHRGMPGGFSNRYFETFHRTLMQNCIERGTVEIFRVSAGARLIGQVYNFIYRGRVYAYQTGFFYEDDPKAKPGLVSHYLCMQQHLEEGTLAYDFMAGDNRYKRTFGIRGPDMAHYVFQRRTATRVTEVILRRIKNWIWSQTG